MILICVYYKLDIDKNQGAAPLTENKMYVSVILTKHFRVFAGKNIYLKIQG